MRGFRSEKLPNKTESTSLAGRVRAVESRIGIETRCGDRINTKHHGGIEGMTKKRCQSSVITALHLPTENGHLFWCANETRNIGRDKIRMQNHLSKNHENVEDEEQIDDSAKKK